MDYQVLQDTVIKKLTTPNKPDHQPKLADAAYIDLIKMIVRTVVATLKEYDHMKQNSSVK